MIGCDFQLMKDYVTADSMRYTQPHHNSVLLLVPNMITRRLLPMVMNIVAKRRYLMQTLPATPRPLSIGTSHTHPFIPERDKHHQRSSYDGTALTAMTPKMATGSQYLIRSLGRSGKPCQHFKSHTSPRQYLRRPFHASAPALVIKPFILADIGEGKHLLLFTLQEYALIVDRHQGSPNNTMVRRAGGASRAIRQAVRGAIG